MSKTNLTEEKNTTTETTENTNTDDETLESDTPMSEEEFKEQYQKLPLWQHVILVILFLFGFTAVIMVINFVVEFLTELLKHIF